MNVTYYKISEKTPKIRNLHELITSVLTIFVLIALLVCTHIFSWWSWVEYVVYGLLVLTILGAFWAILIETPLFYKSFHYGLTEDYLFIKSGIFTISETVVPMAKIQSIELNQGMLMRKFNVFSVTVTTMKGHHAIPYLDEAAAKEIREEIAKLARLKELDE